MTTVTLPNATDAASFEADLDMVTNGATNTDYIIPLTAAVTIANTDADTNSATHTQTVILPTGSTLMVNGSGSLTITSPDELVVDGQVTTDVPITGDIFVYAGTFTNYPATTGTTPSGGVITGTVVSNQSGITVQNYGLITGAASASTSPITAAVSLGGGVVSNVGTITDTAAGAYTIAFNTSAGVINNAGTISSTNSGYGAVFAFGGSLINGGFGLTGEADLVQGVVDGVIFAEAGTVQNLGTISASTGNGAQFIAAATVTNGSSDNTTASINTTSATGAGIVAASGTVTNSASIQGGEFGVQFSGDTAGDQGQVINTGVLAATDATGGAGSGNVIAGVALVSGGTVINGASSGTVASAASIRGADFGVDILSGTGTVTNSGTISGTFGVSFFGNTGTNATGTVIDSGAITSTTGDSGVAILFGSGAEKLTLQQGFAITGNVVGGAGTTDTTVIEVGAGTTGTFSLLSSNGGQVSNGNGVETNAFAFTNVQSLDIDGSANWAFSGTNALAALRVDGTAAITGSLTTTLDPAGTGGVLMVEAGSTLELTAATGAGDTIDLTAADSVLKIDAANSFGTTSASGFTGDVIAQAVMGSSIDLANVAFSSGGTPTFNASTNLLTVSDGTNTANISFAPGLFSTLGNFVITTDGLGGTLVSVACYCPGTRITTPDGEIDVEKLAIGDLVTMMDGRAEPIRWIGRRTYAGRFLAANPKVHPIRFRKGSLGKGLPRRDLLVSPEHAMFINGKLIPARCLVNGTLIAVDSSLKLVEYIHIEFANHEVVLAEGAASESFVDDDSRAMFQNASEYAALYPDAPAAVGYYAERMDGGFEVEAIRAKFAKIAELAETRRRTRKAKAA